MTLEEVQTICNNHIKSLEKYAEMIEYITKNRDKYLEYEIDLIIGHINRAQKRALKVNNN